MKFEYHNPTRLIFGAGSLSRLGELAQRYGKRALLVTGGGSVSAGYPVHMIEHTVSAFRDITHAAGLAIINPAWMRFAAKTNRPNSCSSPSASSA